MELCYSLLPHVPLDVLVPGIHSAAQLISLLNQIRTFVSATGYNSFKERNRRFMVRYLYARNCSLQCPLYASEVLQTLLHAHLSDPLVWRMYLRNECSDIDVHVNFRCISDSNKEIHKTLLLGFDIHERKSYHEVELR